MLPHLLTKKNTEPHVSISTCTESVSVDIDGQLNGRSFSSEHTSSNHSLLAGNLEKKSCESNRCAKSWPSNNCFGRGENAASVVQGTLPHVSTPFIKIYKKLEQRIGVKWSNKRNEGSEDYACKWDFVTRGQTGWMMHLIMRGAPL